MDDIASLLQGVGGTGLEGRGLLEFTAALFASMLLALAYTAIYRRYYLTGESTNESLSRSFVLLSPAVTAIFWVIQFSLPLSLGLLGAMSFVRFRAPIKRAEDIAFIMLVIATGLACSVYRFWVAGILVAVIALFTVVRARFNATPTRSQASLVLTLSSESSEAMVPKMLEVLAPYSSQLPRLVSASSFEGNLTVYLDVWVTVDSAPKLLTAASALDAVDRVDLYVT